MQTLKLGHTNLFVSDIAFGAWAVGGNHWGPSDDATSVAAMQAAIQNGCTLIDTAPAYGQGHSEELVKKAMLGAPHTVKVATKCGLVWDDQGRLRVDNSPENLRREVRESLRRLGVDVIDLYQIHWPDKNTPVEDTLAQMRAFRDEGLVRHWGVCNFEGDLLRQAVAAGASTVQTPLNLLEQRTVDTVLPIALQHGLGVLAYGPLCRGLLTGKYTSPPVFAGDDIRGKDKNFQGKRFADISAAVEKLKPLAAELDKTVGQLALMWVLSRPHSMVALAGARTPAQALHNHGASGFKLSRDRLARVQAAVADVVSRD